VLAGVSAVQLDGPTPCSEWTVRELIDHVVAGNLRVAGRESPGPIDPATMLELVRESAVAAESAFAAPDGISRTYEMGIGNVPGTMVLSLRTGDVFTHAWDLARATGQPSELDPELAQRILELITPLMQPGFRGEGRPFGAEQPCGESESATLRLAAFTGRRIA
jgi:uncharacterized protein (TIGR03086 family)